MCRKTSVIWPSSVRPLIFSTTPKSATMPPAGRLLSAAALAPPTLTASTAYAFGPSYLVPSALNTCADGPLSATISRHQHSLHATRTRSTSVFLSQSNDGEIDDISRRNAIHNLSFLTATASLASFRVPALASASAASEPFVRQGKGYGYTFLPPPGFAPGKKPVPTHLDEVNFNLEDGSAPRYTYGVTVDPVRINSLAEFGQPGEVAARVVTAEVNRDGIFEVTLASDPVEDKGTGAYVIEYISDGKRGKKHFVTRIFVKEQRLYVLTAQVKQEEYADREKEIRDCVETFRPL